VAGIIGTTLMTGFSKIWGMLLSKEFSEPKLLTDLMRPFIKKTKAKNNFIGWLVHYLIGILFAWGIYMYTTTSNGEYTYLTGLILGGLMGFMGVLGWIILIEAVKITPKLDVPAFFVQLVFAHIVFGLGAIWVFKNF